MKERSGFDFTLWIFALIVGIMIVNATCNCVVIYQEQSRYQAVNLLMQQNEQLTQEVRRLSGYRP